MAYGRIAPAKSIFCDPGVDYYLSRTLRQSVFNRRAKNYAHYELWFTEALFVDIERQININIGQDRSPYFSGTNRLPLYHLSYLNTGTDASSFSTLL